MEFEPIQKTYTIDPIQLTRDWQRSRARVYWPLMVAACIGLAGLAVAAIVAPESAATTFVTVVAIASLLYFLKWLKWRKAVRDPANESLFGRRQLTITAESIEIRTDDGRFSHLPTKSLVGWDETKHFILLFVAAQLPHAVPKVELSAAEVERLRDLASIRLGLKRRQYGRF